MSEQIPFITPQEAACLWDMASGRNTEAGDWDGREIELVTLIIQYHRQMELDPGILAYWIEQNTAEKETAPNA